MAKNARKALTGLLPDRMEPQYMIAGHAAGVAAQAIRSKALLDRIDVVVLHQRLGEQKQIACLHR